MQQDIQALNLQGMQENTVSSVYEHFLDNVQSRQLRRQFYDKHNLLDWYTKGRDVEALDKLMIFEEEFHDKLKINIPKKGNKSFVSLSFELNDPVKSAEWLNKYVDVVTSKTTQQLIQVLDAELNRKKINISDKIASVRKIARDRRVDRIVQLQEALEIQKQRG